MIREHVPDCALTTDIIVGFPGETDADFEQTLAVAEEVGYDGAFTFIYSPRRETEAATLPARFRTSSRSSGCSAWSRSCSGAPRSARSGSSVARSRCSSRVPRAPTRLACAVARATTRSSTSPGSVQPGELVEVEISGATSQTLTGQESILARAVHR